MKLIRMNSVEDGPVYINPEFVSLITAATDGVYVHISGVTEPVVISDSDIHKVASALERAELG